MVDYHAYLASREWALKREAVRKRSGNRCERTIGDWRCVWPQQAVHHLTYARVGHERLTDLMAVCNACHEYLSGKTDYDELADIVAKSKQQELVRATNSPHQSIADFLRSADDFPPVESPPSIPQSLADYIADFRKT